MSEIRLDTMTPGILYCPWETGWRVSNQLARRFLLQEESSDTFEYIDMQASNATIAFASSAGLLGREDWLKLREMENEQTAYDAMRKLVS